MEGEDEESEKTGEDAHQHEEIMVDPERREAVTVVASSGINDNVTSIAEIERGGTAIESVQERPAHESIFTPASTVPVAAPPKPLPTSGVTASSSAMAMIPRGGNLMPVEELLALLKSLCVSGSTIGLVGYPNVWCFSLPSPSSTSC